MQMMDIDRQLDSYRDKINKAIDEWTPHPNTRPDVLHQAMHYSVKNGGKRIRPILLIAAFELFPSDNDPYPAAVAIELLHTYSLIHDDLPCMDNSDLRRGHPTCHKQFNEAIALLAGDALLTEAFFILATAYERHPSLAVALIKDLSDAAGSRKLIGGQVEDLARTDDTASHAERLDFIHLNKTAALITSSINMGIRLSAASDEKLSLGTELGHHLGLAFQIIDDILDVSSNSSTLGKSAGIDAENGTLTYTKLYGIETSKKKASEHTQAALQACAKLGGQNAFIREIIKKLEIRIS